jgi:hypothetical protein
MGEAEIRNSGKLSAVTAATFLTPLEADFSAGFSRNRATTPMSGSR